MDALSPASYGPVNETNFSILSACCERRRLYPVFPGL